MKPLPFLRSLQHAWRGLRLAFKGEQSFRIQLAAALLILAVVIVLPIETWQRTLLLFVTMFVLVLELVNSSMERLVDMAKPRLSSDAGDIKDLMAGAVLLAALFATVIAVLILWPYASSVLVRV